MRRGVGYGVGLKNICFSEGYDDYSTARVRLEVIGGEAVALVHTAAAEVGQGLVTLEAQIARTELGVERVVIHPADNQVGDAGSSSASRQSYMTGGAVMTACQAVREGVFALAAARLDRPLDTLGDLSLVGGKVVSESAGVLAAIEDVLGDAVIEETREYHHEPTTGMDPVTGRGDSHTQLALCVHRAVVDVDVELGLVKVVELAAVQDVGKILNRLSLEGQIHGGTAQGLGLAVMEEIVVSDGKVRNPSFTDYLIPTILDMPPMRLEILENADPRAPYGLRGAGATHALLHARDRRGHPRRHGSRTHPSAGSSGTHHRKQLTNRGSPHSYRKTHPLSGFMLTCGVFKGCPVSLRRGDHGRREGSQDTPTPVGERERPHNRTPRTMRTTPVRPPGSSP
nr:hypothetical protein GCM10020093_113440 [Planobispora longispora]